MLRQPSSKVARRLRCRSQKMVLGVSRTWVVCHKCGARCFRRRTVHCKFRDSPMVLTIAQVGEAVLRQRARPLPPDEIRSAPVQELIEHMRETMREAPGVGLAAPQIGVSLQLAVIEDCAERL